MIKSQKNKAALMDELVPSEFYLSQNYPNPFKGKTTIKYCLSEKTKVTITIFNCKDEKVRELVNKVQNAGTYETVFDSYDLPAGIYYYQLRAVDAKSTSRQIFKETKKMLLMR